MGAAGLEINARSTCFTVPKCHNQFQSSNTKCLSNCAMPEMSYKQIKVQFHCFEMEDLPDETQPMFTRLD